MSKRKIKGKITSQKTSDDHRTRPLFYIQLQGTYRERDHGSKTGALGNRKQSSDMQFREDESRARKDNSAENLNVIRHMAYNVLKAETATLAGDGFYGFHKYLI